MTPIQKIIQLLDECRESHAEMDRIAAAGRVSQFAIKRANEADARLVATVSEVFLSELSKLRQSVQRSNWLVARLLDKLGDHQ